MSYLNHSYRSYLSSSENKKDVALVFASYQPNKTASDILRVALDSLEKINLDNISVWIFDAGSPKLESLVDPAEYKKFNFIYVDFSPATWSQTPLIKKIFKKLFFQKAPREGSYANSWTLEFALDYFRTTNYLPKFFMSLQTDVIFTHFNSIVELYKKMLKNKNLIAGGFRMQDNLSKKYKIIHSLACMWNLELFNNLKLNLFPDLPNFDIGEKAIAKAIDLGYEVLGYKNLRTDFNIKNLILDKKFLLLGDGVDICINDKSEVVFLHLGRGIEKSKNVNLKQKKFSSTDWINWYKKIENFNFS